jgi:predicted Rossmann-fold nucleotide-binding protein
MQEMAEKGTISPEDLSLVLLTDSIAEAAEHINAFIVKNYRLGRPHRKWWLFEFNAAK